MKSAFDYLALALAKNTPSGLCVRVRLCEVALDLINCHASQGLSLIRRCHAKIVHEQMQAKFEIEKLRMLPNDTSK